MQQQVHSTKRPGFTVVELLVVIAIIGVLAALITGAVFAAIGSARNATIKMEVSQLAMALERYKTEMGEYPPDFSVETPQEKRAAINAHLARKYRLRQTPNNESVVYPINDNLTDADLEALNPSNALYFWLRGFSTDPQRPLTGAGSRDPFFDFSGRGVPADAPINRVDPATMAPTAPAVDVVAPVIASVAPKADPQQRGYLYYRATPSFPNDLKTQLIKLPYQDCVQWVTRVNNSNPNVRVPFPYLSSVVKQQDPNTGTVVTPGHVEPEKFQIISAGMDGEYGEGGIGTADVGVYPTGTFRKNDRDNITSFNEGSTLEDAQ